MTEQAEAKIAPPVPLQDLVTQAQDRLLGKFAQTVGKPIEEARPIFQVLYQTASINPYFERELIDEEVKVFPMLTTLRSYTPEGTQLAISLRWLPDFAKLMGVRMSQDRIILAMGRIVAKEQID